MNKTPWGEECSNREEYNNVREEQLMDPIDFIRDKFSQDCAVDTVLHLVMAQFGLSEEEARAEIQEYFEIVEGYGK